jgi:hypothetical protein
LTLLSLLAPGLNDAVDGLVGDVVVLSDPAQGLALLNAAQDGGPLRTWDTIARLYQAWATLDTQFGRRIERNGL